MSLLEKILGPKSKYDKSIPYTYEARIRILEGSDEYNSYFSDTICGLVEYLHRNGVSLMRCGLSRFISSGNFRWM